MKRKTLSQVKNLAQRALDDLVDPPPTDAEQQRLRDYFRGACCYCGADAGPREGHLDHAERGQGNGLDNILLACGKCNGDEKRETPWLDFLRAKCGEDAAAFERRRQLIQEWIASNKRSVGRPTSDEMRAARTDARRAIDDYAAAYKRLRKALLARQ
jgi:hypothetical protein